MKNKKRNKGNYKSVKILSNQKRKGKGMTNFALILAATTLVLGVIFIFLNTPVSNEMGKTLQIEEIVNDR